MTYAEGVELLAGETNKKIANNTYLIYRGLPAPQIAICFYDHDTDILTFHTDGQIDIDNGGFWTASMLARINHYLPAPYGFKQKKGEWFLTKNKEIVDRFPGKMTMWGKDILTTVPVPDTEPEMFELWYNSRPSGYQNRSYYHRKFPAVTLEAGLKLLADKQKASLNNNYYLKSTKTGLPYDGTASVQKPIICLRCFRLVEDCIC